MFQTQVDFSSLKQSLELSEKTDFVNLKAENERLLGDIERLKQKLREEITRTQAGVRLDLNLEKVRNGEGVPGWRRAANRVLSLRRGGYETR